jgi:23S rRNA pseudouridine1911/1915/1917 synthase
MGLLITRFCATLTSTRRSRTVWFFMQTPDVLFEDPNVIVIDKPAGLLSQGEHTGDANVVDWLRERLGRPYVGLVHRLDRNTSGIMIVAKRTKAAERLTRALQEGRIGRSYLAWVHGNLSESARWEHRLEKDELKNLTRVVRPPRGKEAVLTAQPREFSVWGTSPVTLVEFVLETGRSHQIRAQAAHEKHPILGDRKYGSTSDFPRPALHSHRLEFPHPISSEMLKFVAPLPDDMKRVRRT